MFDFFCNFFPNCSFYYRKFFFVDKLSGMDILDEREYTFIFMDSLEIPYLKLARYFDFYLGNLFVPSVPAYEKNVREPGYTFVYDIEDFFYFLKENKNDEKLHEFNILYNNKKINYFNLFCRDLYKQYYYSNKFQLLNDYHINLVKKKINEEKEKIPGLVKLKNYYISFLRSFYYPYINDIFFYIYDYTLGLWLTPFSWSMDLINLRAIKFIHRHGHFHKNFHAGKTITDIIEESGYRNVLSRPMRPKPVVTWREYSWVEPEFNKLKSSIYKKKIKKFDNNIDLKYDFEENPILKKKLMKDHRIIENSIVFLY